MSLRSFALVMLVGGALVGCGRSPEELCEDFVDECDDGNNRVDQCVARSERIEHEAEQAGCMDQFYNYVDCVDALDTLCNTADDCGVPREDLARCGVNFE